MMLDLILNAIRLKLGIETDEELAEYLKTLQGSAKALRQAYKSNPKKVDYSKREVQILYLILYFAHYAALSYHVLSKHSNHFDRYKFSTHHLILFGSGPCPELMGYLVYAKESGFSIEEKIKVTSVDIAAEAWTFTRGLILDSIAPLYGLNNLVSVVDVHQIDFDISSSQVIPSNNPSIVVFQNCLNELSNRNHKNLIDQFLQIFNTMQSGSTLLIVDIANYTKVLSLIGEIEKSLASNNNASVLWNVQDSYDEQPFDYIKYPEIITTNLLVNQNGLIPKKGVKFVYSLIFKQ